MNKMLFREKSIERITSPEQLDDRIQVASPSVWMLLLGIFFLLIGICVWGIFGKMDTVISVGAITKDDQTFCYVKEDDIDRINSEMLVRIKNDEYSVERISHQPILVDEDFSDYLCYIGNLSKGEWVYEVKLNEAYGEPESIFEVDIVLESISPVTFVIN